MNMILQHNGSPGQCYLRWVENITEDTLVKLHHRIAEMYGVEDCMMQRYSACITLAPHVVSYKDFGKLLADELRRTEAGIELTVL